jgi:large subunit ribosomal protein L25
MEWVELAAKERQVFGKEACKKLRVSNEIPGVLYGGGEGSISLALNPVDLRKALEKGGGENVIINLTIHRDGEEMVRTVMVKDLQSHPTRGEFLHADFLRISMEKMIRVDVPITLHGESPGVKLRGGILDHVLREVEVECLPAAIPEALVADISSLDIGDSVHVRDLQEIEGVKILANPEMLIASVTHPEKEEEVPVEAAPAEPEVVTRKETKETKETKEAKEEKEKA